MTEDLNDLHDYTLIAWALDQSNWMMIFDLENTTYSVRQEFKNVLKWCAEGIRGPIGILEMTVWEIDGNLLATPRALQSWSRVLPFACSPDEILTRSFPIIDGYKHKFLVSLDTVDGGTIDLICSGLVQS